VNLASQRIAMDAQSFCSSHLICIFLSQDGNEEHLVELAERLGILKAASIHLQNDLFEFFLHGEISLQDLETVGKD